jgi:ABC-type Mn2+/Zn2+ transport system permease subunit
MDGTLVKNALLIALILSFTALLIGIFYSFVFDKPFSWLANVALFLFLLLFWFINRFKKKEPVS